LLAKNLNLLLSVRVYALMWHIVAITLSPLLQNTLFVENKCHQQRISYFSRLQNLPYTRLCKIVFDELNDSQSHPMCDYLNNVRRVFENAGLDHYLNSDVNMITFKRSFDEYVRNREIINAKSKSSLTNYVHFPIMFGKQPYLSNLVEFQPIRFKENNVSPPNTLSINSVLHRMKLHTTSVCEMCSCGSDEDLFHFAEFAKLHMGLVVLVRKMSVLINFLLQNTNLVSVLSKICPNFAGHVW
jgi:hypothetical protein